MAYSYPYPEKSVKSRMHGCLMDLRHSIKFFMEFSGPVEATSILSLKFLDYMEIALDDIDVAQQLDQDSTQLMKILYEAASTRLVELTSDGDSMVVAARTIVEANDPIKMLGADKRKYLKALGLLTRELASRTQSTYPDVTDFRGNKL